MARNSDQIASGVLDDVEAIFEQRSRAVRAAASAARNPTDFLTLLDALGLHPEEGRQRSTARFR